MEKTSTITEVELKTEAWQDKFYFHKIKLANGDKGEIGGCAEANPEWLKQGKPLTYTTKQGRFCLVFTRVDKSAPAQRQNTGYSRETEQQWRTSKKSVILDSCRNRAKDLWVAKLLKNEKAYKDFAMKEYHEILEILGIDTDEKNEVPRELELSIKQCETQDELSVVQKDLSAEEMKNPRIVELLNEQEAIIKSKKD